jgi:hypothetical protein
MPFRLEVWADYETEASMGVPISNVSGKASKILGLTVASPRARTGSGVSADLGAMCGAWSRHSVA